MAVMRSPDEMMASAKDTMLNGREPESHEDWCKIMNFLAYNIAPEVQLEACLFMQKLYDMPLTSGEVAAICAHQLLQPRPS